jgi:hypothetical protein
MLTRPRGNEPERLHGRQTESTATISHALFRNHKIVSPAAPINALPSGPRIDSGRFTASNAESTGAVFLVRPRTVMATAHPPTPRECVCRHRANATE